LKNLEKSGSASVDLRLGCWFVACRPSRVGVLDVYRKAKQVPNEAKLAKLFYVPFGADFYLHPGMFLLGVTLEWVKLPADLAAYVIGRSSWGRHGLIIATATGVHPGFTGCLTLELSNVGEIPIKVMPGTEICQVFFHRVEGDDPEFLDKSHFIGKRRPELGSIKLDDVATELARGIHPRNRTL